MRDVFANPSGVASLTASMPMGDEMVHWNGLAFLASLSPLFRPRSEEEQRFTVLLPDYNASLVKKLLLLLSLGTSTVKPEEVNMLAGLAKDLGVSSDSIRDFMTH